MIERLHETDSLRNKALADAETYNAAKLDNALYDILARTKAVTDTMPLITIPVAERIAERQNEIAWRAVLESATGKIESLRREGEISTVTDKIKIGKTLKKDGYYDTSRASILNFF